MVEVNVQQAKAQFSKLLARVAAGEEVVIAQSGQPVARLTAVKPLLKTRPLGQDRGLFTVPEDFNAPLPADLLAGFEGRGAEPER